MKPALRSTSSRVMVIGALNAPVHMLHHRPLDGAHGVLPRGWINPQIGVTALQCASQKVDIAHGDDLGIDRPCELFFQVFRVGPLIAGHGVDWYSGS